MAGSGPYPEVQQGLKISLRKQKKSKEKHLPRNDTEKHGRRNASIFLVRDYFTFFQPWPFVILANAGIHSLRLVSMDSRLCGNDGRESP